MIKSKITYILYGIFGIAIMLFAYFGLNFLRGTSVFNKTYDYYVYYDKIEGLNTSSIVTVNGFKIGHVSNIELLPKDNQKLKVTINITNEFLLPDSTIARIVSTDLLGSKGIELLFGSSTTKFHNADDILIGEVEQSLKDQVSIQMLPLKSQAENLMKELSKAIEVISYIFNENTLDNLENSFTSIRSTLAHINNVSYEFDSLLVKETTNISRIISSIEFITYSFKEDYEQISHIINNLSSFSDTLLALEVSNVLVDAGKIITKANNIVEKVERGEGSLGQLLIDEKFAEELENSTTSLNRLLVDIRNNPRKYVNFSLIKIGRTVNVTDESELSEKDKEALEKQKQKEDKLMEKNLKKANE